MTHKTKLALIISITLWASAFVGIRAGLLGYSPEGLALFRYLIASFCMSIFYFQSTNRLIASRMRWRDRLALLALGALGIGFYNLSLNYGELVVSSSMASFIISQSPIFTAFLAIFIAGERWNIIRFLGFFVSVLGIILITAGQNGEFKWSMSLSYVLFATLAGSLYTILQKPFLKKYPALIITTYLIWGGTLFLCIYFPHLRQDLLHAPFKTTEIVIYLGIFPAAVGYLAWSYALVEISATQAASFLYFTPFIATLLGWLLLGEVPAVLCFAGGILAMAGVWMVNRSYRLAS